METREVGRTGLRIGTLGLGGAPLGGNFVDLSDAEARQIVQTAQGAGMRYFDTAPWYGFGRSERIMGDALRGTDYVLSDKVGRLLRPGGVADPMQFGMVNPLPFHVVYDYSYDGIMRAFEDNLHMLGLDRIDILFAHDIGEMTHGTENARHFEDLRLSGYRAMDELRRTGAVKAIGIGVNENAACMDALGIGDWDVFLLAGRYTLLEQTALDALFPACEAAGTSIICGGPFNSGILVGRDTWNYAKAPPEVMAKTRQIADVADVHDVPLAAAALQFPLGHSLVTSVIPGPRNPKELQEIIDWFAVRIPPEFWQELRTKGILAEGVPVPGQDK
ncbi:aldo/keto reductase [Thalassococcus lentus]|uniref:Aldo/keto reductase n=1 Tax=Thalassococcus lentus TaxID=1210524 RepID=A0ABT4XWI4_9RHOB|nr:aldo/keto reductase [Thalassococcus lentus]MDA7426330.1 aldo/keto reductase [Thalassococcus lentus]